MTPGQEGGQRWWVRGLRTLNEWALGALTTTTKEQKRVQSQNHRAAQTQTNFSEFRQPAIKRPEKVWAGKPVRFTRKTHTVGLTLTSEHKE